MWFSEYFSIDNMDFIDLFDCVCHYHSLKSYSADGLWTTNQLGIKCSLYDFINDLDLDICAIAGIRLKEEEEESKATLKPDGYEICSSQFLLRQDGGIAIIHKENL